MLFKDISYLEVWSPLCSAARSHLCDCGKGHQLNSFEEMSFKDDSYLELWRPFYSMKQNHLCIFGSGHHEEQF